MYTDIDRAPEFDLSMPAEDFYRATSLAGKAMYRAPLGYRNARDAAGRLVIVPDPPALPLVEKARRMRVQGKSVLGICRAMKLNGLRPNAR